MEVLLILQTQSKEYFFYRLKNIGKEIYIYSHFWILLEVCHYYCFYYYHYSLSIYIFCIIIVIIISSIIVTTIIITIIILLPLLDSHYMELQEKDAQKD